MRPLFQKDHPLVVALLVEHLHDLERLLLHALVVHPHLDLIKPQKNLPVPIVEQYHLLLDFNESVDVST